MIQQARELSVPTTETVQQSPRHLALKGLAAVVSVALFTGLAIAGVLSMHRPALQQINLDLPTRVLPGSPLPEDAHCDWYMMTEQRMYCNITDDGALIHFSFDMRHNMIASVTLEAREITVGDLMLDWGEP